MTVPRSDRDQERLEALRLYDILDTGPEDGFDDLARLATHVCQTPMAVVSFVDEHRIWAKAGMGFPFREWSREEGFSSHAILEAGLTVVRDTLEDERFAQSPLVVNEPHVRFFAGAPLLCAEGVAIGTLSVMDVVPRSLSPEQAAGLWALTRQVMTQLELRRRLPELKELSADRTRAEGELRETQRMYRGLIEAVPTVTYIDPVNPEQMSIYVSPQIETLLGCTQEQWLYQMDFWHKHVHPDDEPRVWQEWERCRESGEPYTNEYRMLHEDGRIVWVSERAVILRNESGQPLSVQGVLLDITERKRVEEELEFAWQRERESAQHLRAMDDLKNTLLHAVSHDLRGPITAVLASARILERMEDELSSGERRELVQGVSASAKKLNRLVSDLLDFDRLDRGIVEPDRKPTDVAAIIRRVAPEVEDLADRSVEFDLEPLDVSVDPASVERIVENLLVNTARHTPKGTHVWVRLHAEAGGVLLVVEDDGPGVPESQRSEIFEPFRQGDGPRKGRGLGIGLSLVWRFAALHDGWADVIPREGGGSCFRVFLADGEESGDSEGAVAPGLRAAR
ncbi:MAG: PAS domain-containing protein [Actinomycetota bacterium]|nr:PAS domain-containing protein [Actinomycetota bacterium]